MKLVIAMLMDGVIYASWLFVIAAGLTLIYGVMRILNMAHGSFYAIGAYGGASLVGFYLAGGWRNHSRTSDRTWSVKDDVRS